MVSDWPTARADLDHWMQRFARHAFAPGLAVWRIPAHLAATLDETGGMNWTEDVDLMARKYGYDGAKVEVFQ